MRNIRAIVYGIGEMGKIASRMMLEKGVEIAGAIGNKSNVGKDLGEIIGLDHPLNVTISNKAEAVLKKEKADIVVMSVGTTMEQMYPHFRKCLENGVNVITIAEEAFYPWRIYPKYAQELDELAKEHSVTLTAVGIQDVFWLNLLAVLSGASHSIKSVLGQAISNADNYGPLAIETLSIGATEEEFYKNRETPGKEWSCFGIALESIIADLGLNISKRKEWVEPILCTENTKSKILGETIRKGLAIGKNEITEIDTEEHISFRVEFISKILKNDERETSGWSIKGVPDLYLENKNLPGPLATCAAMVNRIPDVINSVPGFITVNKLPKPKIKFNFSIK
jgi:4-hydroxy-tetrahydrodipicolinate reductase